MNIQPTVLISPTYTIDKAKVKTKRLVAKWISVKGKLTCTWVDEK